MRQSKWQPTIDPTGSEFLPFLIISYTQSYCHIGVMSSLNFTSQQEHHCSTSKTIPWHSPSHSPQVSRIFLHVQDLSSRQDLHLSFFRLPSFYWNHFLLGTCPFITSSSLQNSRTPFSPVSVVWSTTHMVSLVTGGSVSCLFINCRIQDVSLLFNPGVTKICYLYQLQLVAGF